MVHKANAGHRILAILLAVILIFGMIPQNVFAGEPGEDTIKVIVDFEGYNLGQGFYIEPTELILPEGATAEDATRELLIDTGHEYNAGGTGDEFYLSGIKGFDTGEVNVPAYIADAMELANEELGEQDDEWLSEQDYTATSGWMITVNHEMLGTSAGAHVLTDGDVIRWQFTVVGLGTDLGLVLDWGEEFPEPLYTHADKTALIRAICTPDVDSAKANAALDVVINPLATSAQVTAALNSLYVTTNKTALNNLITRADTLKSADYTSETWAAFASALASTKSVNSNKFAVQATVDASVTALQSAIDALRIVNKITITSNNGNPNVIRPGDTVTITLGDTLYKPAGGGVTLYLVYESDIPTLPQHNAALAAGGITVSHAVQSGGSGNPSIDTLRSLSFTVPMDTEPGSYTLSKPVFDGIRMVQSGGMQRPQGFNNKLYDFTGDPANYQPADAPATIVINIYADVETAALEAKIAEGESTALDGYTYVSKLALLDALEEARAVLANMRASQEQIDEAVIAIDNAIDGLSAPPTEDGIYKGDLAVVIAQAQSETFDPFYYVSGFENLQTKLTAAQSVFDNDAATQIIVDAAFDDLFAAINALIKKDVYSIAVSVNSETTALAFSRTDGFDADGFDIPGQTVTGTSTVTSGKKVYSLTLPTGTYSVRGQSLLIPMDGTETELLDVGGTYFTVPSAKANTDLKTDSVALTLASSYARSVTRPDTLEKFAASTDYALKATDKDGKRVTTGVKAKASVTSELSVWALLRADKPASEYTLALIPTEATSNIFLETTKAIDASVGSIYTFDALNVIYRATVPTAADFYVYKQLTNYKIEQIAPYEKVVDGDVTHYAYLESGIWRASMPGKITQAHYGLGGYPTITFGEGEDPKAKGSTIKADRDSANIFLNINSNNHLQLDVNEEFKLRAYRVGWQIITNDWANVMIEPDFHYNIIQGEDVISLTPWSADDIHSQWTTIKALKEGVAIVEISYDAIDVSGASTANYDGRYGASEMNGYAIITVGGNTKQGSLRATRINNPFTDSYCGGDTEFSTYYFTGDNEEANVSAGAGDTLYGWSPNGSDEWKQITDGQYTFYPGGNIFKITHTDGSDSYTTLRARKVTPTVTSAKDKDGNDFDVTTRPLELGDNLTLNYGTQVGLPCPKMSGIYNPQNYTTTYIDSFTVTQKMIDEGMAGGNTQIIRSVMGSSGGAHRTLITDEGKDPNMSAGGSSAGGHNIYPAVALDYFVQEQPVVEKTELNEKIEEAEALTSVLYTAATWTVLETKLGIAKDIASNDASTQAEVDEALAELNTAISGLALKTPSFFVTAPEGATVKLFAQQTNYRLNVAALLSTVDNDDGTITYGFDTATGNTKQFRVSLPGKITKAGYLTAAKNTATVTFDEDEDPEWLGNTTSGFANNDDANTLLNIPGYHNVLNLTGIGDTYKLRSFRAAWQIVSDVINNQMIEPDFHYNIISGGDVISITPDADIPNWATITALKEGTAVVEVYYDAIDIGGGSTTAANTGRYGATTPTLKGLAVVTVGPGKGLGADMTVAGKTVWDSEFDIFYTLGDEDQLEVDTTEDATITASNPGAGKAEAAAADGKVTVYPGNNIIKSVSTGGDIIYKVVRAAKLTPVFTPEKPEIGETFTVRFDGLVMPLPKMSGIYNPAFNATKLHMDGTDADVNGGQYTFSHNTVLSGTYTDETQEIGPGYILSSSFGSAAGTHRYITDIGVGVNTSAPTLTGQLGVLPVTKLADYFGDEPPVTAQAPTAEQVKSILDPAAARLAETVTNPAIGSAGGEWTVLALARGGYITDEYIGTYLGNLAASVTEKEGVLSTNKYTEYSRVILALSAIGTDPADIEGYDLLSPLADYNRVIAQGINGPIYALIALDAKPYDIPALAAESAATQTTRENLIDYILGKELTSGGWALSGSNADPDITSMTLQALAPYYNESATAEDGTQAANVKAAVEKALIRLSDIQTTSAGFTSWGTENAESVSQVLIALNALGIPLDDERFVKDGKTVYDNLMTYYIPEQGAFKHIASGGANGMATDQATYALVSLYRSLAGANTLYDMSDVTPRDNGDDTGVDNGDDGDKNPITPGAVTADKTLLLAVLTAVSNLSEANYTAGTWDVLKTARTVANTIAQDSNATVAQVSEATKSLLDAITGLAAASNSDTDSDGSDSGTNNSGTNNTGTNTGGTGNTSPVAADKSALNVAITIAGTNLKATGYTAASWATLQAALASAKATTSNRSATVEQVNAATLLLIVSITGLVPKDEVSAVSVNTGSDLVKTNILAKSKDAKLKKIKLSKGKLSGKFKASKTSYKLKLSAKKKSVKITPVTNHAKAKVKIKVGNGKYKAVKSVKVKLKKGRSKTVKIKVTAENGVTKIYKVKVIRAKK
jgi:hypothetical protein